MAVQHILGHSNLFSFGIRADYGETVEEYLDQMSRRRWGDEHVLRALAIALQFPIIVHHVTGRPHLFPVAAREGRRLGLHEVDVEEMLLRIDAAENGALHLSFHGGNHYNSVVPLEEEE